MTNEETCNRGGPTESDLMRLIHAAREGDEIAMAQLVADCRPYLLAIANVELDEKVAAKVGASDIVQNSIVSAQRCLGDFAGTTREELLAWLRGILIKDLRQTHRHFRAAKRHIDREQPLRDDSLAADGSRLVDAIDSPSTAAAQREQEHRLHHAIGQLSDEERRAIELRNWQRLSFAEIGERLGRSSEAARKLWSRAILRLQKLMEQSDA